MTLVAGPYRSPTGDERPIAAAATRPGLDVYRSLDEVPRGNAVA